jgi:hypothetical protein
MIDDILRDDLQPILSLYYLDFGSKPVFQPRPLRIVKILIFDNFSKLLIQIVVLDQNLGDPLLVEQWHRRAIIHGLLKIVF